MSVANSCALDKREDETENGLLLGFGVHALWRGCQSIRNVCAAEGGENEETECRVSLLNRRKNGSLFYNQLLLKHIYIDGIRFVIGFQNEVQSLTDYQSQAGLHSVMHTLQNLGMRNYVRRKFLG